VDREHEEGPVPRLPGLLHLDRECRRGVWSRGEHLSRRCEVKRKNREQRKREGLFETIEAEMDTKYPLGREGPQKRILGGYLGPRGTAPRYPVDKGFALCTSMAGGGGYRAIGLQLGAEEGADVMVIAEAVADQAKRNQHGTYDLVINTAYLAVYVRKDRRISCRKRGKWEWVVIGWVLEVGYIPQHLTAIR